MEVESVEKEKDMKREAAALVAIAKSLVAEPMTVWAPVQADVGSAKKTLMLTLRIDSTWKTVFEQFLTVQDEGHNKFHYFAVFQNPKTAQCVGGNAYGRIGYGSKAMELARGSLSSVVNTVKAKMYKKQREKGYQVTEV